MFQIQWLPSLLLCFLNMWPLELRRCYNECLSMVYRFDRSCDVTMSISPWSAACMIGRKKYLLWKILWLLNRKMVYITQISLMLVPDGPTEKSTLLPESTNPLVELMLTNVLDDMCPHEQYSSVHTDIKEMFNRLFRRRSKLRVTGICEGNAFPGDDGFPSQRASNVESVSSWWH